ncbi:pitrilysin family protein [Brevundimonas sp.]|uniref:M16 family metallopeptidase n=1 Tax=Brevundimonas sp. TaxID=1871086 RepID=UPI002C6893DC|nr:pitrilysin family protein [Brevundimonas sp.]HWQ88141.1 pitrilysin family protein [Brevundimonas sp.]
MTRAAALLGASLLALSTFAAGPAPAQTAPAPISVPPLEYTHRELANGLDVYAMPDATAGTVTVTLWYDVGGKDDPQGRSGFAHLFEHILSRKTVNLPYGQISTLVENAGGSRNASTGQDFTNYYETVPPQYLETMLWTHAERMARPVVDDSVFQAERSIVKEELRQRVLAPPYGRFQRFVIGDNSFDESIYRRSVIGSIEELDSAVIDDARAFHEAYYRPATATMIVSGNFDPAQLDRWVDQYFADIPNPVRPVPVLERPVETPRTAPRMVEAWAPNVPLPAVGVLYPGIAANHPDNAALDVLQGIMSRGESSRLYQSLVYGRQLASNVGFGPNSMEEDGSIAVTATVARGKSMTELEAALDAELARVRDEPVTAAELAEAKTEIVAGELRQRETASGRAFILGQAIVSENDPRAPDARLAAIQAVTAADVQRVARTYLNDQSRVSLRYQDESARPAGAAEDSWRNPAPVPTFLTVPPAVLPAHELLPEGQRMAPPAPGPVRAMATPQIAERTLPNGLRVIVARSTNLPIMNAQLVMGGGAAGDSADRAGLASMTASLATQGAGDRSAPEIARTLEALGANIGGGAGADATTLFLSAPVASADQAGAVFADVVMRPTFAEEEVARSRTQAVNRLRVNLREPGALAAQVLNRLAYGGAAYGAAASGTPESVEALTRDQIAGFHDRWWRPDNAALIITGGMEPEQAFAFAERTLGGWERPSGAVPTVSNRAGDRPAPRIVVVDLPGAGQAAVAAAVRGPRRSDEAFYPLAVVNSVIGGGQNGRLFQEVRAKRGLSYGANSSLGARVDGGLLAATTQTKNESAAEVVGLVLAEFDRLKTEAVTDQAVTDREAFITGGFSRAVETTGGLGGVLADAVTYGLPLTEVETYAGKISATTPEGVMAAAQGVGSDQAYVVVVGQSAMFIDALRAAHPDVVVIPAADLDLNSPTPGL